MGIVVQELVREGSVVVLKQAHARVVAVTAALHGVTKHGAERPVGDTAVGEDGNGPAVILPGNFGQRVGKAAVKVLVVLRSDDMPAGDVVVKQTHLGKLKVFQMPKRQILPAAKIDLPKAGICVQGQVLGQIQRLCRFAGTEQVTGVYGVDRYVLEALFQRGNLPVAVFGDEGIIVPVDSAVDVSLGFSVADNINMCHFIALLQISEYRPAFSRRRLLRRRGSCVRRIARLFSMPQ